MDEDRRTIVVLAAAAVYLLILAGAFGGILTSGARIPGGCTAQIDFTYTAVGLTVTFTDASYCLPGISNTYVWNFGDGAKGNGPSTSHTYLSANTYNVTETVVPGGSATKAVVVQALSGALVASFAAEVVPGNAFVLFFSSVGGGTSPYAYAWTFGDGATSTYASPGHIFANPGTYPVQLVVTDAAHATATSTKVIATTGYRLTFTPSFTANVTLSVVAFSASCGACSPPATYAWSFGDGTRGSGQTTSHTYAAAGTYTVVLRVTDATGVVQSTSRTVTTASGGTTSLTVSFTSSSSGLTATFVPQVLGGTAPYTYAWMFGDGGNSTSASPSHTYAAPGNYTVQVVVKDAGGNPGTAVAAITVTSSASSPVPVGVVFLAVGLVALLVAIVVGLGDAELEEREKWAYGLALLALGAFLLVEAGLAWPYVPKPF